MKKIMCLCYEIWRDNNYLANGWMTLETDELGCSSDARLLIENAAASIMEAHLEDAGDRYSHLEGTDADNHVKVLSLTCIGERHV